MNAKKCDRCGKYYDVYNTADSNKNINSVIRANTDEKGKYWIHKTIEFCPDCKDDFERWLKNED